MSTIRELRRLLKDIADTVNPEAAEKIRHRIGQIERDKVADWRPQDD